MRLFIILALPLLVIAAHGAGLSDKTPAYFVDRYGPARSSKEATSEHAMHIGRGDVTIKGQFVVREFQDGELRVHVVFFLPSLQLASVRLQLNRQWTKEQVQAALAAYGGEWKLVKQGVGIDAWVAPDGTMAINMLTWVDFQSKAVVDLAAKTLAESDAKRKAIPKF